MWRTRLCWAATLCAALFLWLLVPGVPTAVLLAALVVLPALAAAAGWLAAGRLRTSLVLAAAGGKEKPLEGEIQVENPTFVPFLRLRCKLHGSNTFTGEEGDFALELSAPPRGAGGAPFEFGGRHCGRVHMELLYMDAVDLFGLTRRRLRPAARREATLLPATFPMAVGTSPDAFSFAEGDETAAGRPGQDYTEPLWLRDYQPGDSLRSIHWKLTGKLDRMVVRQPSLPVKNALLVLFEHSGPEGEGPMGPEQRDALGEAFFTLCQALADQGIRHEAAWWDEEARQMVFCPVDGLEDVTGFLPRVLAGAPGAGTVCLERYVEEYGADAFSRVLYVSPWLPPTWEALGTAAYATALLCGEADDTTGAGAAIAFTPASMQSELAYVTV